MPKGRQNIAKLPGRPALRVVDPEGTPLRDRSDESLMIEQGEGSEDAFGELVRRHQRGVLNYTYRMVGNRQVAEELTQEVFLALVKNGQRYRPTAKFTTYLYAIASNIVCKEWQRAKRRPKVFNLSRFWRNGSSDSNAFDPIEHVGDERACVLEKFRRGEITEAVTAALQKIPAHQREAFVLHRLEDRSYDEVAEIMNAPVGTVKSRVVRAERALRPLLTRFREYV